MTSDPSVTTLEDTFGTPGERKRYTNTWGLSDEQLARRDYEVKVLKERYPSLPASHIEMYWSFVETADPDHLERIVKEKLWEGPPRQRDKPGTVVGAISVE